MSCALAAATTCSTRTSSCNPTKIINSTFSLHSNSIRQRTHFVKVPRCGLFKKKHAMRIPKRSIASLLSPFQLNFSLFHSPISFLDYPKRYFTHFATTITPICACAQGLFFHPSFLLKFVFLLLFGMFYLIVLMILVMGWSCFTDFC